jgi:hypothetical protein
MRRYPQTLRIKWLPRSAYQKGVLDGVFEISGSHSEGRSYWTEKGIRI